jgi:thiamine biosynthesis lipoprotein
VGFRFLLLSCLLLTGCSADQRVYNDRFLAFGTLVELTIADSGTEQAIRAAEAVEKDFQVMHRVWHAWDPGPLGRVNQLLKTGGRFAAPPSILPLITLGQDLSAKSGALFNPAIGHLIKAWGFHGGDHTDQRPPPRELIDKLLLQNPQMQDITVSGIYLQSSNPAVKLDFGAFGKGYGIDLAIAHLRKQGIENAILNAGGDLRAIGSRFGNPWRIAIRHPGENGVIAALLIQGDESVFTSGNYERRFRWQGKSYHHIIDPRTGYPAQGTASVTVVHSDAVTADAAATALFIAGPEQWHSIARAMGLRYVLLIDQDGTLHMNPAMQERLELTGSDYKINITPPLIEHPADSRHWKS